MLALNTLSNNQKSQLRNAFTLIDGESRDSLITLDDLKNIYKTIGIDVPSNKDLISMLQIGDGESNDSEKGLNFTQFLNIIALEILKFDDRMTIYKSLKTFAEKDESRKDQGELIIDVDRLKEACCSVQLGEIGSGDHRLSRSTFDKLVKGFVKEQTNGKKLFLASKWMDAYVD